MKGLEATEITLQDLNDELRIDSDYHRKSYLREDAELRRYARHDLATQAFVTDGQHGYHVVDEASPIRMLTAKNARNWFADVENADPIAEWVHLNNQRSSLQINDLILSSRGTVGLCALVTPEVLPANIDQDVARVAFYESSAFDPYFVLAYINGRFGHDWLIRNATGMVQQGVSLQKLRTLPLPQLSNDLQQAVRHIVEQAFYQSKVSGEAYMQAETLLLRELGLDNLETANELIYTRSFKDVDKAARFDSQYYHPKAQRAMTVMGQSGQTIGDVAPLAKRYFTPQRGQPFQYIEIGSVGGNGQADSETVLGEDAPSRAQWIVRTGDVITSTVRPIRRLSALIEPEQDGFVCSSGFAVLEPKSVSPELLTVYLRLPIVCEILDLHTTASLYPAISTEDLLSIPITLPGEDVSAKVIAGVQQAHAAREKAARLLETAKRAVEVAIEDGAEAALRLLDGAQE